MTALQEIAAWAVGDGIEWLPGEGVRLVKGTRRFEADEAGRDIGRHHMH